MQEIYQEFSVQKIIIFLKILKKYIYIIINLLKNQETWKKKERKKE